MSKKIQNSQICILEVKFGCKCQGCEKKIKKVLGKIQGVEAVNVDLEGEKVRVVGDVDPNELLTKFKKHMKKDAKIYNIQKGKNPIVEKKNDNDEEKKSKVNVCVIGSLFVFGKNNKNECETCKNCKNNSNSKDAHDIPTSSHHGGEGSNGNTGQMVPISNNNSSMQLMNNGASDYHQQQRMQMQLQPYPSYDQQQQYMNQQQTNMNMRGNISASGHHGGEGSNGNMGQIVPSTMMYDGPSYSSYHQQQYMNNDNSDYHHQQMLLQPNSLCDPQQYMNYMMQMQSHPNYRN